MAKTDAGWFRDPTGRADRRYWDGNAWTDSVARGTAQSTDLITGDYAPPEAPPTPGGPPAWQPPQQQRKRRKWPWVLLAVFVLGLGGCTAIIVVAATSVNKAVEKLNAEQQAHAISKAQFDAVPLGASRAAVIQMLGKQPENTQEFVNKGVLPSSEVNSSCIYYNRKGEKFGGARFQFCFDGDNLRSKNAY